MKRVPLAVLLALGAFAVARADEGAYKKLVGMARAAATDRGPDADSAPEGASRGTDGLKDALADVPASRASEAPKTAAAPGGAAAQTRLWTRLYSTLLPSWRHPASLQGAFDPVVSTVPFRTRMTPLPGLMPPPDSEAVAAGERRGLEELMSASAPKSGQ